MCQRIRQQQKKARTKSRVSHEFIQYLHAMQAAGQAGLITATEQKEYDKLMHNLLLFNVKSKKN